MRLRLFGGKTYNYVGALAFMVGGVVLLLGAVRQPDFGVSNQSPGIFPAVIGVITMLAGAFLIIETAVSHPGTSDLPIETAGEEEEKPGDISRASVGRLVAVLVAIIAYVVLVDRLHFFLATFAFLALCIWFLRGAGAVKVIVISLCAVTAIQLVFGTLFRVMLP